MLSMASNDFANCINSRGCNFRVDNLLDNLSKSPQDSINSLKCSAAPCSFNKVSTACKRLLICVTFCNGNINQRFNKRAPIGLLVASITSSKPLRSAPLPMSSKLRMVNLSIHKISVLSIRPIL